MSSNLPKDYHEGVVIFCQAIDHSDQEVFITQGFYARKYEVCITDWETFDFYEWSDHNPSDNQSYLPEGWYEEPLIVDTTTSYFPLDIVDKPDVNPHFKVVGWIIEDDLVNIVKTNRSLLTWKASSKGINQN